MAGRHNNYSLACNPQTEFIVRLNVRIATPPPGQACPPGVGSAYMFSLKPGDTVTAVGPFGDFHIRPTQKEMVYIGGGSGMVPLRSHMANLMETEHTARRVNFWYGARSRQELYYQEYFEALAAARQLPLPTSTFRPAAGRWLDGPSRLGPRRCVPELSGTACQSHCRGVLSLRAAADDTCLPANALRTWRGRRPHRLR